MYDIKRIRGNHMQEFLNQLSNNLIYTYHEVIDNTIHIHCETKIDENKKVHQTTVTKIKDLPFGQYKTILHIKVKRYKNEDSKSLKKTITEKLDFLNSTKRRTQRLENSLYNMLIEGNFIGTERNVNKSYVSISDSSLLRLFKKKSQQ